MKNKILLGLVIIVVVSLGYAVYTAKDQIYKKESDYTTYQQIQTDIDKQENLESSIEQLGKLQNKYDDSYVFDIDRTFAYKNLNKNKEALDSIEQALDKNKGLYKNVNILLVYAELAHLNKDDENAKDAIQQAQVIGIPSGYQMIVDNLLSQIQ